MSRKEFDTFDLKGGDRNVRAGIATVAATLASGKNPDGTNYTLPVSATVAVASSSPAGIADAALVAATANLRLLGYTIRESAGSPAAAAVNLRNGDADTDPLLAAETFAASGSEHRWFGPNGISCADGVFLERVSGNTTVVVYTAVIE